jgi:hypothetical protein
MFFYLVKSAYQKAMFALPVVVRVPQFEKSWFRPGVFNPRPSGYFCASPNKFWILSVESVIKINEW